MLGSASEADDAVQEAWLRLSRADASEIRNLPGWLVQTTGRICLDMLRARKARREDSLDAEGAGVAVSPASDGNPEDEAMVADSVGLALLVVMDRLEPAERLAFVLHDLFAVPFDEIAPIVGRTPAAARQLASRARRRVRGPQDSDERPTGAGHATTLADLEQQQAVVDAFLAAARAGDLHGLLAVLDPDVTYRAADLGAPAEIRGAATVAPLAMRGRAVAARPLLVNGAVGVVVAPRGRLMMILDFTIRDGSIIVIDAVAAPARVAALDLAAPEG